MYEDQAEKNVVRMEYITDWCTYVEDFPLQVSVLILLRMKFCTLFETFYSQCIQ